MGVFMVVRAGAALVGRFSEMLVSYRWAPTIDPLSYLVQMTDAVSVPRSTTIYKSSDNLRALFLARNPRTTRGSGHRCCGWLPAETLEIGHFLGQRSLFSVWPAGRRRWGSCKINNLRVPIHRQPRSPVRHRTPPEHRQRLLARISIEIHNCGNGGFDHGSFHDAARPGGRRNQDASQ